MSGTIDLGAKISPAQRDWVQRVLGFGPGQGEAGKGGLVALQQARLAWDALRKSVQAQLRSIERGVAKGVAAHNADETEEDEFDETELAAKVPAIYKILDDLDTRLIDKLDEALNAEGEARAKLHAEAKDIVAEYKTKVDAQPLLAKIDASGFAKTTIRDGVQKTLAVLDRRL